MKSANIKHQSNDTQVGKLNILWGFDASEHASAVMELLEDLQVPRITVTALCVMPTQYFESHELIQHALDQAEDRLEQHNLEIETFLKTGNPAVTLNATAEEIDADLILLGAKGLRATLGILLGGVAQQVVEYSTRPVMVVRAPYRGLKHILVVTDGSSYGSRAVEYLAPRCHRQGESETGAAGLCPWLPVAAQVTVMHVLPPPLPIDAASRTWTLGPEVLYPAPVIPVNQEEIEAEETSHGAKILEQARSLLVDGGFIVNTEMPRGDAASLILDYADKHQVALIVCGSRGLNTISSWLLGSVSRKLVHYANCSVMIVK